MKQGIREFEQKIKEEAFAEVTKELNTDTINKEIEEKKKEIFKYFIYEELYSGASTCHVEEKYQEYKEKINIAEKELEKLEAKLESIKLEKQVLEKKKSYIFDK